MRVVLALCIAIGMACGDVVHGANGDVTCEDGIATLHMENGVSGALSGESGPMTCEEFYEWKNEAIKAQIKKQTDKMEAAVAAAQADVDKFTAEANALEAKRIKDLEVSHNEGYKEGYHDCTAYVLEQAKKLDEAKNWRGW